MSSKQVYRPLYRVLFLPTGERWYFPNERAFVCDAEHRVAGMDRTESKKIQNLAHYFFKAETSTRKPTRPTFIVSLRNGDQDAVDGLSELHDYWAKASDEKECYRPRWNGVRGSIICPWENRWFSFNLN